MRGRYDKIAVSMLACVLACPSALTRLSADQSGDPAASAGECAPVDAGGLYASVNEVAESRKSAPDDEPGSGQLGPRPLPVGLLERGHTVWQHQVSGPRPVERVHSRTVVPHNPSRRPTGAACILRSRSETLSVVASPIQAHAPPAVESYGTQAV